MLYQAVSGAAASRVPGHSCVPSFCDVRLDALEERCLFSASAGLLTALAAHQSVSHPIAPPASSIAHYHRLRAVAGAAAQSTRPMPVDVFPIGVWYQPAYLIAHWKAVGVNTLVGYESEGGAVSLDWWESYATGMYEIRQPGSNLAADAANPNLLAWMIQPDEPDGHGTKTSVLANQYAALKAADPTMPIFANFDGSRVLKWQGKMSSKGYQAYLASTDWDGSDVYPVTGWNNPSGLSAPGDAAYRLSAYSGGKPQFAFIETSDQNLPWLPKKVPGVTTGQLDAEIWEAINRGVKGIVYFPQQIGGFAYDATPRKILAEMAAQNARLSAIAGALESPLNPSGVGLTVDQPLEGSWRSYNGKNYFIVTNTSATAVDAGVELGAANVPATGFGWANVSGENRGVSTSNGSFTDHFGGYQTHVYVVG